MLKEFENKPVNGNYILLEIIGNINEYMVLKGKKWNTAENSTNISCTVYNTVTYKMSTKTAYLSPKSKRLYLKTQRDGRLYLDEFVDKNGLDIRID